MGFKLTEVASKIKMSLAQSETVYEKEPGVVVHARGPARELRLED